MEKLKMHSPDLTQDNIAKIRELFPGCVTEAITAHGSIKLAVENGGAKLGHGSGGTVPLRAE